MPPTQVSCLPPLQWDSELAEVAQVWADQCAMILYRGQDYPKILHEKSYQRTTSRFGHPPGVGQNVAWALTEDVNFTQIIDDLWYRDIHSLQPGLLDSFKLEESEPGAVLVTQMLWGHTTHIGCGWLQVEVGEERWADTIASYPGSYENFFVCNYGVGGNVPGQPVYQHPDCQPASQETTTTISPLSIMEARPQADLEETEIFSNFSVASRAVIGSCLAAIRCLETSEAGSDCLRLSEVCHTKGRPGAPASGLAVSRSLLECRIDNVLCQGEADEAGQDCQQRFDQCATSQSPGGGTEKSQFNTMLGE